MDLLDAASGLAQEADAMVEAALASQPISPVLSQPTSFTQTQAPGANQVEAASRPSAPEIEATELVVGDGLTERERQVLAFEKQWWRQVGAKEQAIRDVFEVTATRYYQTLNTLLDNPAALQYDPALVARLRGLRDSRSRTRGRMTPRTAA